VAAPDCDPARFAGPLPLAIVAGPRRDDSWHFLALTIAEQQGSKDAHPRLLVDPAADDGSRWRASPALAALVAAARRPPSERSRVGIAGPDCPHLGRLEILAPLSEETLLVVDEEPGAVHVSTPRTPDMPPMRLRLFVQGSEGLNVSWNGRPLGVHPVLRDTRALLLSLRWSMRTGISSDGIVECHP
jgi:hypothetical protein